MRFQCRSIIVLTCSVITFVLTSCITSGEVNTLSLQPESVIGGENVTGSLTISMLATPANTKCQTVGVGPICPIQIMAQPVDTIQVVGSTFPGLVIPDQGIVFAGQNHQANFIVQTSPVQQETVVTLTATFLLCPFGRIPNSITECRPQAVSQDVQLVIWPEPVDLGFICDDPFDYGERQKPPLPLRNSFGLPAGFEELTLNNTYVIGFNFTSANAALIAQPIGAKCQFHDPALGFIVGAVWDVVGSEGEPYVVSIPLDEESELVEGFLFRSLEEMIPVKFQVDQLQPVDPDAAVSIDVSIRSSSVCFRIEERRFCSLEDSDGGSLLSARQQFGDDYRDVAARISQAEEILQEVGLHDPNAQVLVFDAISEIEQPDRIQECIEDTEACIADLIIAPVVPPQLIDEHLSDVPTSLVFQKETEIAILVLTESLTMPADANGDGFELPAGDYVLYAYADSLSEIQVIARGIPDPQQPNDIIEIAIPAVIMPYVDPNGVGKVAIYDVSIYDRICLFWEQCSFLSPR